MKTGYKTQLILLLLLMQNLHGQGFVNLDFEAANVSGFPPGSSDVPVSSAFPGWTASYGTNVVNLVWYDAISIGGAIISVNDSNTGFGFAPLSGNYSAYLFGQGGPQGISSSLSQTGLVPLGTRSLQMEVGISAATFVISLGGQTVNMIPLSTTSAYTIYGGDVSSFAGKVATLELTAPPPAQGSPSFFLVDDIVFSPNAVPEPSARGIAALGLLIVYRSLTRRRVFWMCEGGGDHPRSRRATLTLYEPFDTSRMKITTVMSFLAAVVVSPTSYAQGFANLNFEQAAVVSAPPGYTPSDAYNPISATSALLYWTVREDGAVMTAVWGTPVALDETSVALVLGSYSPIQGSYSVQLSAYADAPSGLYHYSSISQTGVIPVGSQFIQFLIASPSQAGSVQPNPVVTVNGTPIGLSRVSPSGGVITMAGDISAFAGTTATLTFLCQATQGGGFPANENIFNLDGIQFVPEPSTLALFGLGALLLVRPWRPQS